MKGGVASLWHRAQASLMSARRLETLDPNSSASRSYYAAFYAVSAYFLSSNQVFSKHKSVEVAVHRELVHAGRWESELGRTYSQLYELRLIGDYGVEKEIGPSESREAIEMAERLVQGVHRLDPDIFPLSEGVS